VLLQDRLLVITSQAMYRVAFKPSKGCVSHYSRTSLGNIKRVERGRLAFKVISAEADGRENPFAYMWSEYVSNAPRSERYERLYYPLVNPDVPFELGQAVLLATLQAANRLLCAQVGEHIHVSLLQLVDHQPATSVIDEVAERIAPSLQRLSEGLSGALKRAENSIAAHSRPSSAGTQPTRSLRSGT